MFSYIYVFIYVLSYCFLYGFVNFVMRKIIFYDNRLYFIFRLIMYVM